MKFFSNGMKNLTTITSLNISLIYNKIGTNGAYFLSEVIEN